MIDLPLPMKASQKLKVDYSLALRIAITIEMYQIHFFESNFYEFYSAADFKMIVKKSLVVPSVTASPPKLGVLLDSSSDAIHWDRDRPHYSAPCGRLRTFTLPV